MYIIYNMYIIKPTGLVLALLGIRECHMGRIPYHLTISKSQDCANMLGPDSWRLTSRLAPILMEKKTVVWLLTHVNPNFLMGWYNVILYTYPVITSVAHETPLPPCSWPKHATVPPRKHSPWRRSMPAQPPCCFHATCAKVVDFC